MSGVGFCEFFLTVPYGEISHRVQQQKNSPWKKHKNSPKNSYKWQICNKKKFKKFRPQVSLVTFVALCLEGISVSQAFTLALTLLSWTKGRVDVYTSLAQSWATGMLAMSDRPTMTLLPEQHGSTHCRYVYNFLFMFISKHTFLVPLYQPLFIHSHNSFPRWFFLFLHFLFFVFFLLSVSEVYVDINPGASNLPGAQSCLLKCRSVEVSS